MDEATAARAVELIEVSYELLPAVFDPYEALADGELVLPAGVSYRFAGNYENQVRAAERLALLVPVALVAPAFYAVEGNFVARYGTAGLDAVQVLLGASVVFGIYSFMMCLLWAEMGAVDVAFTEATVGAGVSTIFFISAIFKTTRRSKD